MRRLFAPHLSSLVPYVPGKPIEETERQYGVSGIAKLASNENCLGPSPKAKEAMAKAIHDAHLYPDAGGYYLKERLAKLHDVAPSQIALGNGTNELIVLLVRGLLAHGEALLNAWPSFVCYRIAARCVGAPEVSVPLTRDLGYDLEALAAGVRDDTKLVFIANPNNPTGRMVTSAELDAFFAKIPSDVVVVLDEAYAEYVQDAQYPNGMAWVKKRPRTVVLRTFSKIYGLAGLRIGYAVADPEIADLLNRLRDAFNTSAISQAAALAALDDQEHVERSRAHNAKELVRLRAGLEERGFTVTPSVANFVLAELGAQAGHGVPALQGIPALNEALLRRGVIVRPVANYDLPRSVRISVGTVAENDKLLAALDDILAEGKRRMTKPMVVAIDGPAGAGKSTVAKMVAQRAGLQLVDTGAIYRTVALLALRRGVSVDDAEALAKIASELARAIRFEVKDGVNRVFLESEDVSQAIRTPDVSAAASSVSRHPPVRAALLDLQRELGKKAPGAVLEGRDIGTVVFPDASVKAFVTASPEERAKRRVKELPGESYEKVLADIIARDKQDSERAVAPLKPAPDAVLVDTTGRGIDDVVTEVLGLIHKAG